ncbi:DEDD exonuclease domain-containing protein [Pseudonocardia eucalypti]|uniref:DEDD exonuclease domain-containing protein n=1 Tax=Pseudonocardia eucalypti TaxID=648755 RepID=A0ABP9QV38_9PSEU|nr:DNA polymerase-3 subunit epsilon [Pseudonocardia eucalypti]
MPQLSFDELGIPLREVTFVVVDLETTGGSAGTDAITEVGAVKVRGGERLGELSTLVDPGTGIAPSVVALTGITRAMVTGAPRIGAVLPSLLEFCAGAVLVAHNAPFDTGFLRAACARHDLAWPRPAVLCTARLARAVLPAGETPTVRLSALAELFGTTTRPTHRALDDARATVEVLHALLERVGNLGVHSLEELLALAASAAGTRPTDAQRRNRKLAEHLPNAPGVYLFRGAREEVLYVGTSGDLRKRVRSYFTAAERRRRVRDMVAQAVRVDAVECAHALEARVRELRLIGAHRPRYNRRSRTPNHAWWVALTDEPFPRLSVVNRPRDGALGPFRARALAVAAVDALQDAVPIRRCTQRISARAPKGSACVLAELGRCGAPCTGRQSVADYAPLAEAVAGLFAGRSDGPLDTLAEEVGRLATDERFEAAAVRRDRLADLIGALDRAQRLTALAALPELTAAHPDGAGGWEFAVIRHGRLASAGVARRGVPPMPVVEALLAGAETARTGPGPLFGAPEEEVSALLRWVDRPGTRLVLAATPWAEPARGAGRWRPWLAKSVARTRADKSS